MADQPVIRFENVSKDYPGILALDQISFEVHAGRIHGFLGPNGAGKSTAMNILTGLIPPKTGQVTVFDHDVQKEPLKIRESIGFLPENPPLYDSMRVWDFLKFVYQIHSFHSSEKDADAAQAVDNVIQSCGLSEVSHRLVGNLSKGYRQRVGIAQALVFDPKIVVLDEPTIGLDPKAIVEIRELIKKLAMDRTVLLSSHLLHEVELLCDDITIIHRGKIVQSGNLESVQHHFQTGMVLKVSLEKWDDDRQKKLKTEFPCEKVERLDSKSGEEHLEIYLNSTDEAYCSSVSRFLVNEDCGLLHFERERLSLEDIFHLATESQKEKDL